MAKDRRRSKQRRPRADAAAADPAHSRAEEHGTEEAPEPLGHASADVDLVDAQLAVGRPELAEDEAQDDLDDDVRGGSAPDELEDVPVAATGRDARRERRLAALRAREQQEADGPAGLPEPAVAEPAEEDVARPASGSPSEGPKLVAFLQASWRELQRVQWPDRQQVAQATGVVLVFVVIAGLYLGLTGEIASRLVKALL